MCTSSNVQESLLKIILTVAKVICRLAVIEYIHTRRNTMTHADNLSKKEVIALFNKLFTKEARTLKNWQDLIDSLVADQELTERTGRKYKYILARTHITA